MSRGIIPLLRIVPVKPRLLLMGIFAAGGMLLICTHHSGVVSCLPGAPRASLPQPFSNLCCCKDLIFLGKDEVQGGETLVELL